MCDAVLSPVVACCVRECLCVKPSGGCVGSLSDSVLSPSSGCVMSVCDSVLGSVVAVLCQ